MICVLPAYNAEKTLKNTIEDIDRGWVDEIILVDDCSLDNTAKLAEKLGIDQVIEHTNNLGYGGNQKTCYGSICLIVNFHCFCKTKCKQEYWEKLVHTKIYKHPPKNTWDYLYG